MAQYFINAKQLDLYIEKYYVYHLNKPDQNCYIIDLRDRDSFLEEHIAYALNLPYDVLDEKLDIIKEQYKRKENLSAEYLDASSNVLLKHGNIYVCYCNRGTLSYMIASKLNQLGYAAKTLSGGFDSYRGQYRQQNN